MLEWLKQMIGLRNTRGERDGPQSNARVRFCAVAVPARPTRRRPVTLMIREGRV
ncbi:hypothetical protein RAS1_35510 [Phycisphaerae bacterium RAS1]|nr:hypothetical protein RAS1_35510 [Phycisphaerae bacterium RAS1]